MNADQYEGIVGRLDAIRAALAADLKPLLELERPASQVVRGQRHLDGSKTVTLTAEGRHAARLALYTVLTTLDSWIETAYNHHDNVGHRDENIGEECWTTFHPAEFRTMINEAARELGVGEFRTSHPKEKAV